MTSAPIQLETSAPRSRREAKVPAHRQGILEGTRTLPAEGGQNGLSTSKAARGADPEDGPHTVLMELKGVSFTIAPMRNTGPVVTDVGLRSFTENSTVETRDCSE